MLEQQTNRPHRKTKEKKKHTGERNPKAFAFANPGKLAKQATRSHDVKEKKLHVPMVDRTPEEPPPIICAIVGPPGTGKTTLVKSLVKRYTKHMLTTIQGPITVVTGKRRRLTFIECNNDVNSMVDLAKIADIVLLMIDGNFGFEMETMEFLNILAPHGLPSNIFGILTHLDLFKSQNVLKATKKRLKHRFWSELYQGAKLFYLSGVMNGRYPDREIQNLSRFISVMKNPRPLKWRNDHYYMLADRMVDLTDPTEIERDKTVDRQVALYGYVRGQNLPAENGQVHIPGVEDLAIASVEQLPDPCPTPYQNQQMGKTRRRLGEKEKLLYAPMSDVGGVLVDKDAVYVEMPNLNFNAEGLGEGAGMGERLVVGLQQGMRGKDTERGVQLFAGGEFIKRVEEQEEEEGNGDTGRKTRRTARLVEEEGDNDDDDEEDIDDGEDDECEDEQCRSGNESEGEDLEALAKRKPGRSLRHDPTDGRHSGKEKVEFTYDSDLGSISGDEEDLELDDRDIEEESDEEDHVPRWKQNLSEKAREMFSSGPTNRIGDLTRMIYDMTLSPAEVVKRWRGEASTDASEAGDSEDHDDDFFKKVEHDDEKTHIIDRSMPVYDLEELKRRWSNQDEIDVLRARFITGNVLEDREAANAANEDGEWGGIESAESDSEGDGDFVDLENGEKHEPNPKKPSPTANGDSLEAEREANARKKAELRLRFEEEDREGRNKDRSGTGDIAGGEEQEFGEDDWYAAQKAKLALQSQINKAELSHLPDPAVRIRVAGHPAGSYVRIVLSNVPCEFVRNFDPTYPILIGGLTPTEQRYGLIQVRIKRHRWHKKILKTNDPLILSLGWRRFQTQPIYSISDSRTRNRMLKYTPEHMHCFGTFYGPLIDVNTGFCAFQTLSSKAPGFRVAATGVVLSVDQSSEIVKKLKLSGTPVKIFKNTAFIRDMFTSALEIAKFEGAAIRTVSGIRGQIKRALARPEGHFRATFEDKILMSDIVFLRAWYPVKISKYYNTVTNLLLPAEQKDSWVGMRLTGEVRRASNIPTPMLKNSAYRAIDRPETRRFNPLKIPSSITKELPFANKVAQANPQRKKTYLQKRAVVESREERRARELIQQVRVLEKEKREKRREKDKGKKEKYLKRIEESEDKKREREKRERDEFWRKEGRKRGAGDGGGGGGKRRK
ncbi:DUF663-domain-containing protein [Terfezia boudieri ATCC MYA-4762]|uniref:DUF663-domain-containing protein n=1 Tax=Terfezia boudieri ATCC MYA-4762 TaxID=1051890 RepID=A0A3N4LW20_9PEZI|nr:DUF663-domain-containing protein [Terfezia boudieri ATCC MYA-4762]